MELLTQAGSPGHTICDDSSQAHQWFDYSYGRRLCVSTSFPDPPLFLFHLSSIRNVLFGVLLLAGMPTNTRSRRSCDTMRLRLSPISVLDPAKRNPTSRAWWVYLCRIYRQPIIIWRIHHYNRKWLLVIAIFKIGAFGRDRTNVGPQPAGIGRVIVEPCWPETCAGLARGFDV